MGVHDNTDLFRELLVASSQGGPPPRHRRRRARDRISGVVDCKQFALEASKVLLHIRSLSKMLSQVQGPYLNLTAASSSRSRPSASDAFSWANIQVLTDDERDQIDFQAKQLLTTCSDRVREMEQLVKKQQESRQRKSGFLGLLSTAHSERNSIMDFEAAHLAGITWHLSHELAIVSQQQTDMQEQRRNLQQEQSYTLASTAQKELASERIRGEAPHLLSQPEAQSPSGAASWFTQRASSIASSIVGFAPRPTSEMHSPRDASHVLPLSHDHPDSDSEAGDLSEAQLQAFESENAALLRTVQSDIAALQQAESRLLEISALQSELVIHLTKQTELTDQLYEDAIASTEMVHKGNVQLQEARRRSKDSRIFILVFLLGASFALLFLHYY